MNATTHTRRGIRSTAKPIAVAIAVLAVGVSAPGASAQGNVLEEVMVTAQKREQSLQDVGIAVSSFTGAQMNALGVQQSFDVATFTPGVHISGNLAGQNTQFSIRGVTQNDFNDIIEAPNALYIDEGYVAVAQGQSFAVMDIERVEILKGPQGTLFGRNATGGLVHYITRKPNLETIEGYIDLTYGEYDSPGDASYYTLEGALSVPFSSTMAGRIALRYNDQDPYLENIYPFAEFGGESVGLSDSNSPGAGAGADMGDDETLNLRGSLLFEPNDSLTINLSYNYADTDVATGPYQSKPTIGLYDELGELVGVEDAARDETRAAIAADGSDFGGDTNNDGTPDFFGRLGVGTDFFGYLDPDGDDFKTSGDFAFSDQGSVETQGFNGKVSYELNNGMTLVSITDWKDFEKLLFIDVDSAPVNQLANYAAVDATTFSQEFRLSGETESTRWVAGLYYLNIDNESDNGLKGPENSLPAVFDGPPQGLDIGVDAELETDSYAAFGQVEWSLNEDWTLITGLRVTQEEKDYDMTQGLYFNVDPSKIHVGEYFLQFNEFDDDISDTLWTGKVQLDWTPSDDLLLYAGVNRGVKAASYNAPIPGGLPIGNEFLPYGEEELVSIEGGFKYTFPQGTTRLNGSLFYYDYQDYQAFLFTGVSGVVVNADAETVGAELELQSSPIEGLDLILSGAWFDAEVQDVPLRVNTPLPPIDVDPTYAPEIQLTGLVRYEWGVGFGRLAVQGDVSYSDSYYYNLRNFDGDEFDDYTLVNARLTWLSENDDWQASLFVQNATDERAGIQGFDLASLCGCNEVSYRAPRTYGANVRYAF
jgi:iron complex outermembrane receptor protein